ncbi:hypothetical protein VFPFJ_10207 [Purpureocillium lilacinum]|uniref:Infection structure specific protein n=2 Tax=Purpureocillium lilacinum TaxID=33203 RepID=A0A179GJX2_PURLI|nr:hypothetical protein VFPFJ_10207 [Purpureocillium lilacinum]OAQ78175.1 hypothetical protein VFPFJ_10207 [Purpureocillium lilacinum]PWI73100.1 hypothetical protein PCL_10115 [Purpureocillium lilacinum]
MRTRDVLWLTLLNGVARGSDLAPAAGVAVAVPMVTPPPAGVPARVERQRVDSSCISSIVSELAPPTSGLDSDFLSWASSASTEIISPDCTVTVPASISSEYLAYRSTFQTYLSTIASKASSIRTNCGADDLSLTFSQFCTTSLTVLFTSGADKTSTTSLSSLDIPDETIAVGQSSTTDETTSTDTASANTATGPSRTTAAGPSQTTAVGSKEYPNLALVLAIGVGIAWSLA